MREKQEKKDKFLEGREKEDREISHLKTNLETYITQYIRIVNQNTQSEKKMSRKS